MRRCERARQLLAVAVAVLTAACGNERDTGAVESSSEIPARPHDLVLVTVDTLRADRLGLYGYDGNTSPFLDSLAGDSVVFDNVIATCPATAPSIASTLTGLHRASHGVARNGSVMPKPVLTIAEILSAAGYRTAGLISNPTLDNELGFEQGFELYGMPETLPTEGPGRFAGAALVDAAGDFLDTLDDEPVFLWVHFMDPHGSYFPPEEYRELFDPERHRRPGEGDVELSDKNHGLDIIPRYQRLTGESPGDPIAPRALRARYDAEIRYTDDHIAALVDQLRRHDRWDRTIFVVSADHGESLGEHSLYFQHGWFAYEDALRVPLMIRAPGLLPPATRVSATASTIDITPTLLWLLGIERPPSMEGQNMLPLIQGIESDRAAFAQTYYGNRQVSVRIGNTKYIYTPEPPAPEEDERKRDGWFEHWPKESSEELYDLATDPGEIANLVTVQSLESQAMRRRVEVWLADQSDRSRSLLDEMRHDTSAQTQKDARRLERDLALEDMLRSLGYLE